MPVNRNCYVIVNIWTSKKNPALPGVNCGHASITLSDGSHISLFPGEPKPYKTGFFQKPAEALRSLVSDFVKRPASYKQSYEQDCLLEMYSEDNFREISDISMLKEGESLYRFDTLNYEFDRISDIPRTAPETDLFLAIRPLPATFRVVFYSLDEERIKEEFKRLQEDITTGWSMAGSNGLTRDFSNKTKTPENCASLVYRCLKAGGLYDELKSQVRSQTSSAVAPDDLLRHLVATKERELKRYGKEIADWTIEGVEETPLEEINQAYADKGLNANAERDVFPKLKPSNATCSLL